MDQMYKQKSEPNQTTKLALGIIVILVGVMLLLRNMDIIDHYMFHILFSWQMLLIGLGFVFTIGRHSSITGIILMSTGIFFLLPDLFPFLPFEFSRLFWPLILIVTGIALIIKHNKFKNTQLNAHIKVESESTQVNQEDYLNEIAIFGGSKHQVVNHNFKGGKLTAIFGGAELDFRPCKLSDGINTIEIACLFGGASLIVPSDWNVQINVISILGGFADKRFVPSEFQANNNNKTIIIKGIAILGGGEIKSQ